MAIWLINSLASHCILSAKVRTFLSVVNLHSSVLMSGYALYFATSFGNYCHQAWNRPYLLTYCTVQIPSWAANWFAASQEFPRISPNPKVHCRTHKRTPPVSILCQPNPVHIPTSHLLEIHPNIIHPSTPRSPQWSFPSGFPTKNLYTPLSWPIRATCPAHLILLHFITRTMLGEEYKSDLHTLIPNFTDHVSFY